MVLTPEEMESRLKALEAKNANLEKEFVRSSQLAADDPVAALSRDLVDLGQVPSCGIHNVDNQTITTGTNTTVTFSTVTWDTDGLADLTNNRINIRRAGIYLVTATSNWSAETTGIRMMRVRVNALVNSTGQTIDAHATLTQRLSCSAPRYFDTGDTIDLTVHHNKGSDTTLLGSTSTNHGAQLTATLIADTGDIRTEMA